MFFQRKGLRSLYDNSTTGLKFFIYFFKRNINNWIYKKQIHNILAISNYCGGKADMINVANLLNIYC
jgi:hypothetical protein